MDAEEKVKRLLQDDWEIHGEPQELLLLIRSLYLQLRSTAGYVANHTSDKWAKDYLKWKMFHDGPDPRLAKYFELRDKGMM